MFHIGQKVVCVDVRPSVGWPECGLSKGDVYTIRGFDTASGEDVGIYLEEIYSQPRFFDPEWEPSFHKWRFRPVIEKKTDTGMAILREILDRENVEDRKPARV